MRIVTWRRNHLHAIALMTPARMLWDVPNTITGRGQEVRGFDDSRYTLELRLSEEVTKHVVDKYVTTRHNLEDIAQ